jgi:DNA-binding transcriptional MerR regulator
MPVKNKPTEKIYYTMGEVAEIFKVNQSLIRHWEKKFDIIKPYRNKKGNRLFTKEDLKNFYIIYHLLKERGFTIPGAIEKLKDNKEDTINNIEVVESLHKIKRFLEELKEEL